MPSNSAQKKTDSSAASPEQQFESLFYQPYRSAVETAFVMLCRARSQLSADMGEETVRRMTFRLKSPGSISDKLRKKHLPVTCEAAGAALHDIAGLRVVLSSVESVYRYAALLTASPLAEYVSCRDYIACPKVSGYRSLHLLMTVPVICRGQYMLVPVEIQLRTSGMDAWAIIDHEMCYKPRTIGLHGQHVGRATQ